MPVPAALLLLLPDWPCCPCSGYPSSCPCYCSGKCDPCCCCPCYYCPCCPLPPPHCCCPVFTLTIVSRWKSYSKRFSCSCSTGGKSSNSTPLRASCTQEGIAHTGKCTRQFRSSNHSDSQGGRRRLQHKFTEQQHGKDGAVKASPRITRYLPCCMNLLLPNHVKLLTHRILPHVTAGGQYVCRSCADKHPACSDTGPACKSHEPCQVFFLLYFCFVFFTLFYYLFIYLII